MRHIIHANKELPVEKILANWQTVCAFIYTPLATTDDLRTLILHEILHKNREIIVARLTTRLINIQKQLLAEEINTEIKELRNGIGESNRKISARTD